MSMLADYVMKARAVIDEDNGAVQSRKGLFSETLKKVPAEIRYTLLLFVTSRIVLTIIGVFALKSFRNHVFGPFPDWLKLWGVWDSTWYIEIAKSGYSTVLNNVGMANYTFFPLYPLCMRIVATFISDYYWAGVIVSNVALLVSCLYIYRLVRLESDDSTAMRSIKYLFLFPTAFILSGIFTESLFLMLSLMAFYYAKKGNWLFSGAAGFCISLTRPYGVIIMIPLAYEYLRASGFKKIRPDALYLLLAPAGIAAYSAFNYFLTGDPIAFMHAQHAWGAGITIPLVQLWNRLFESQTEVLFNAYFSLISLAMLLVFYKKINVSYLIYGAFLILIPLCTPSSAWSMSRYILVTFPLFIIFARLGENKHFDESATIFLAMLQGILMALWTTSYFYVI